MQNTLRCYWKVPPPSLHASSPANADQWIPAEGLWWGAGGLPGGARDGIWRGLLAGMWGDQPGCHRQEVGVKRAGQEQDGRRPLECGWAGGEASKLRGTSGMNYKHLVAFSPEYLVSCNLPQWGSGRDQNPEEVPVWMNGVKWSPPLLLYHLSEHPKSTQQACRCFSWAQDAFNAGVATLVGAGTLFFCCLFFIATGEGLVCSAAVLDHTRKPVSSLQNQTNSSNSISCDLFTKWLRRRSSDQEGEGGGGPVDTQWTTEITTNETVFTFTAGNKMKRLWMTWGK